MQPSYQGLSIGLGLDVQMGYYQGYRVPSCEGPVTRQIKHRKQDEVRETRFCIPAKGWCKYVPQACQALGFRATYTDKQKGAERGKKGTKKKKGEKGKKEKGGRGKEKGKRQTHANTHEYGELEIELGPIFRDGVLVVRGSRVTGGIFVSAGFGFVKSALPI